MQYYEVKVCYERQADNMGMKKVNETYLVDALSITEAEERIIKELKPLVSIGELEVVGVKRVKLAELHLSHDEQADTYYRAKVSYLTIDERTSQMRASAVNMLVQAETLQQAVSILTNELEYQLGDYLINSITETAIQDVYLYNAPEQ